MPSLSALAERVLRLPPPPVSPDGPQVPVRVFHPGRGFYRLRLLRWLGVQLGSLAGLAFAFGWTGLPWLPAAAEHVEFGPVTLSELLGYRALVLLELASAAAFVVQLPFTFAAVALDVRQRWYLVARHSLRVREGLVKVTERTMTFANVQNVTVRQGPLQRLVGIADLHVRSAGGGGRSRDESSEEGSASSLHEAVFRGIDDARELRDLVLERVRANRGTGLGERRPATGPGAGAPREVAAATARLRRSAAALEAALGGGPDPEPPGDLTAR